MTDEPTRGEIIRAVARVLAEFAPHADAQDVEEFIETLWTGDLDELEVNIGAGFGQLCRDEATTNAAFARYAELIGAERVIPNPSRGE